jgi:hypothetical protein
LGEFGKKANFARTQNFAFLLALKHCSGEAQYAAPRSFFVLTAA